MSKIKTKLGNTCGKYTETKVPCKYRKIIHELRKREEITFLKANKELRVKNSIKMLEITQYGTITKIDSRLKTTTTTTTERKVKNPTGSSPGNLYWTEKISKLTDHDGMEELPTIIISNLNTSSYHLDRLLANMLSQLSTSEYNVPSGKEFMTFWWYPVVFWWC